MSRRYGRLTRYEPFAGDIFGGTGRALTVPVSARVIVHNVTVASVILGPYCVHGGSVFAPGPDTGELLTEQGPGQVNC